MTAQLMRYWAHFKRGGNDYTGHLTATAKHKRNTMSRTYKAVQATQPGKLEVVERAMIEPAFGQVRIRVEACGVCHSDALTVEGGFPGLTFPRVPGHEALQRYGNADEIASFVAYLASPEASYITGASLLADGGFAA